MIESISPHEFVEVTSNGIKINLDNNMVNYFNDLKKFVNNAQNDYWITEHGTNFAIIADGTIDHVNLVYKHGRLIFETMYEHATATEESKKAIGFIIVGVIVHVDMWKEENGIIDESETSTSSEPWPL